MDVALRIVNKQRADLGAYQNRLEMAITGIDAGAENLQAAESRIRDTDMAAEMVNYTKDAILLQAGTAMLAQANAKTKTVLQLLG
jgi:flagellin